MELKCREEVPLLTIIPAIRGSMTNAYFISYSTEGRNEFHVWHYGRKAYASPNPTEVIDYLLAEQKRSGEQPKVIVLGMPDFEKKVIQAFGDIQKVEKEMEKGKE